MTYKGRWPGTWAVNCEVCGFRFPSDKIKKRWDGVLCCEKDWETRHPQTLIKIRGETAVPAFVNKDPDVFLLYCDMWSSSGYADFAIADCARADRAPSISLLYDVFNPIAIADIAVASQAVADWATLGNI